jgi:hypothetical protein
LKQAVPKKSKKKFTEPITTPEEIVVERGPRFRVESDALHSRTFTGKVSHGTFSLAEKNKGRVERRLQALTHEGYKHLNVVEVLGED